MGVVVRWVRAVLCIVLPINICPYIPKKYVSHHQSVVEKSMQSIKANFFMYVLLFYTYMRLYNSSLFLLSFLTRLYKKKKIFKALIQVLCTQCTFKMVISSYIENGKYVIDWWDNRAGKKWWMVLKSFDWTKMTESA